MSTGSEPPSIYSGFKKIHKHYSAKQKARSKIESVNQASENANQTTNEVQATDNANQTVNVEQESAKPKIRRLKRTSSLRKKKEAQIALHNVMEPVTFDIEIQRKETDFIRKNPYLYQQEKVKQIFDIKDINAILDKDLKLPERFQIKDGETIYNETESYTYLLDKIENIVKEMSDGVNNEINNKTTPDKRRVLLLNELTITLQAIHEHGNTHLQLNQEQSKKIQSLRKDIDNIITKQYKQSPQKTLRKTKFAEKFKHGNAQAVIDELNKQREKSGQKLIALERGPLARNKYTFDYQTIAKGLLEGKPLTTRTEKDKSNVLQLYITMDGKEYHLNEIMKNVNLTQLRFTEEEKAKFVGLLSTQFSVKPHNPNKLSLDELDKSFLEKDQKINGVDAKLKNITQAERMALNIYTSQYYSNVNELTRGEMPRNNAPEDVAQLLLTTALVSTGIRGLCNGKAVDTFRLERNLPAHVLKARTKAAQNGEVISEATLSTSVGSPLNQYEFGAYNQYDSNKHTFVGVLYHNVMAADLRGLSKHENENELTLAPGQIQYVGAVDVQGGKIFVAKRVSTLTGLSAEQKKHYVSEEEHAKINAASPIVENNAPPEKPLPKENKRIGLTSISDYKQKKEAIKQQKIAHRSKEPTIFDFATTKESEKDFLFRYADVKEFYKIEKMNKLLDKNLNLPERFQIKDGEILHDEKQAYSYLLKEIGNLVNTLSDREKEGAQDKRRVILLSKLMVSLDAIKQHGKENHQLSIAQSREIKQINQKIKKIIKENYNQSPNEHFEKAKINEKFKNGNADSIVEEINKQREASGQELIALENGPLARNKFTYDYQAIAKGILAGKQISYRAECTKDQEGNQTHHTYITMDGKEYYLNAIMQNANLSQLQFTDDEKAKFVELLKTQFKVKPQDPNNKESQDFDAIDRSFLERDQKANGENGKLKNISQAERLALNIYTSPYYSNINSFVRGNMPSASDIETKPNYVAELMLTSAMVTKGINGLCDKPVSTFRLEHDLPADVIEQRRKAALLGDIINEATVSTAINKPLQKYEFGAYNQLETENRSNYVGVVYHDVMAADLRSLSVIEAEGELTIAPGQMQYVGALDVQGGTIFVAKPARTLTGLTDEQRMHYEPEEQIANNTESPKVGNDPIPPVAQPSSQPNNETVLPNNTQATNTNIVNLSQESQAPPQSGCFQFTTQLLEQKNYQDMSKLLHLACFHHDVGAHGCNQWKFNSNEMSKLAAMVDKAKMFAQEKGDLNAVYKLENQFNELKKIQVNSQNNIPPGQKAPPSVVAFKQAVERLEALEKSKRLESKQEATQQNKVELQPLKPNRKTS